MRQTWRWFGPADKNSLADALQAGAQGIVTALHHIAPGEVWPVDAISERQRQVSTRPDGKSTGLHWDVVESLPVSESIKTMSGDWRQHIQHYNTSLTNLAKAGIRTVCYNFMPVLDWTRTDLAAPMAHGGTAMRFDLTDFAVFDLHILGRGGAGNDYPESVREQAARRFAQMPQSRSAELASNVTAGLPGSAEQWTLSSLRDKLKDYEALEARHLRQNHIVFLTEVVPHAERLGVRLCCHPDDPPFPLLGLPRIMSTAADYRSLLDAVDSPAAGMTFCTGSLGARSDNDVPAMAHEFAERIHFVHLRNVTRQDEALHCSFFEDEHLGGQVDMVAVIAALLAEERRRVAVGRTDCVIPMRPDHGQNILDDLTRDAQPGYPAVGRLKGLAELRGIMHALEAMQDAAIDGRAAVPSARRSHQEGADAPVEA
ncbi:MAG: mannonate dehydratase [Alphaproteobacteria bacterium]|nr:mannonate dehydratase [Alphaproteobacteria bacterium]